MVRNIGVFDFAVIADCALIAAQANTSSWIGSPWYLEFTVPARVPPLTLCPHLSLRRFPETARCMALMGAEVLFYPTAIGNEPQDASIDSQPHWTRTMQVSVCAELSGC